MTDKINMFNKRQIFIHQLIILIASILLCNHLVLADQNQNQQTKLKSASELDYPPFAIVRPDGKADGFSVDLLKAVVDVTGLEVGISVGPWGEIKQQLIEGHLDVLPLVAYSPERDKVLDFTAPYLQMHGTIFIRKGETSIRSEADLKGKEVLVMRDDSSHEYAVSSKILAKLILTTSFEEAMKLLSSGKHDAVLCQYLVGLQLIKKLDIKNIVSVSSTETEENLKPRTIKVSKFEQKFSFAVPEGRKKLLAHLNEGLAIVVANGKYDQLYQKWFGPILPQPTVPLITIIKSVLFILTPILFVLAVVGVWYMRREIYQKTRSLRIEIDERKQVEKKLKASKDYLEKLTNSMWDTVFSVKMPERVIEWANDSFRLIGYEPSECIGKDTAFLYANKDSFLDFGENLKGAMAAGKGVFHSDQLLKRKSGKTFPAEIIVTFHRENDEVVSVTSIVHDITERKQAEDQIKASLIEKETLLQEIHHRVKNNMQVISSLLKLQANTVKDERVTAALTDSWNRIQAMSAIHEILYQSKNLSSIDMNTYLSKLAKMEFQNYSIGRQVNLIIEAENILIGVKRASPVGLIVNELISNSLKYAFPDNKNGEIKIGLEKTEQEQIELTYLDNGVGIPKDFDWYNTKSMGLNLVKILSEKQLGGSIKLNRDQGTCFTIAFKQEED